MIDLARRIIATYGINTLERARSIMTDDRSHGDEYLADAAQNIWNEWDLCVEPDDEFIILNYVSTALEHARDIREGVTA